MPRWGLVGSVVACVLCVTGCVQSGLVECDDGRVCPAGYSCDTAHGGCALDGQLTACEGKAELDACSFATVTDGVCSAGVCLPAGCGNRVLEDAELCDDGNQMRGDGCSADCLSTETCGNGVIDVVKGESCDDGNTVKGDGCQDNCVTPYCGDGSRDASLNEACDKGAANSQALDAECRLNCQPRRCGDGVPDSDEACDDGNQASDDGCSFDCDSIEVCGNGYIDYVTGELCDDGDSLSHDGCGLCQPEPAVWTTLQPTPSFPLRFKVASTHDAARGHVIVFGGQDTSFNYTDETWAWNGTAWSEQAPVDRPPPRGGAALAYDAKRGVLILFGGASAGSIYRADTWEWNGNNWRDVSPLSNNPPGRDLHALAYDDKRNRVVLFGGRDSSGRLQDTWEWNGSAWTEVTLAAGNPGVRYGHGMAYDAKRSKVVLFGGALASGRSDDTWEWDGTAWTDLTPLSGNPTPREEHALAYDASAGRVVLHGGFAAGYLNDTWEWTGSMWMNTNAGTNTGRYAHGMAYDSSRHVMVTFAGNNGNFLSDTWERTGTTWAQVTPAPSTAGPNGRESFAFAYDSRRGRILMHGGLNTVNLDETWEWSRFERAWRARPAGPTRFFHSMAYDPYRDRVVMFGGHTGTDATNEVWEWDGNGWADVTPASGDMPAPRYHAALAYDPERQRIVLVGGRDGASTNLPPTNTFSDTWEWNGSAWELMASGPPGRWSHRLAYDVRRKRMVLFAGRSGQSNGFRFDLWERAGTVWTEKIPAQNAAVPGARYNHQMIFNPNRGRTLLFGGVGSIYFNDSWEWDGSAWAPIAIASRPSARFAAGLAFEPFLGGAILFGGYDGNYRNDTSLLRFDHGGSEDGCRGLDGDSDGKVGCADHDCFGACSPLCSPGTMTCPVTGPRCGDGECQPLETDRLCPADCGAPAIACGDYVCESPETLASCPGDCTP